MTVTKVPLSSAEKKTLSKFFNLRLVIGLLFVLPILITTANFCFEAIIELATDNFDFMTIFKICMFIVCAYLFFKFVVPFYKQTFKNITATHKLIIETIIIDIKTDYSSDYGYSYIIQTESPVPIHSMITSFLDQTFGYKDMHPNMKIRIHCMEDNQTDILYIEPITK